MRAPVVKVHVRGGLIEQMRLLGTIRPPRLLERWSDLVDLSLRRFEGHSVLVDAIEPIGRGELVRLGTSARTYIAEGLLCHNTIDKMAKKRAYVDAVLSVTGASEIFTQDIGAEDTPPQDSEPAYGPLVAEELKPLAIRAAISLCGGEVNTAQALWQQIETALDGYMPHAAAIALLHAARQLSARHVQAADANRGLTQAQLANLLRAAAGAAPLDPPRAQAQLPALLERITDPIARKTLELITACTKEAAVPANSTAGTTTPNATPTGSAEPSPPAPPADQDIDAAQQRQRATIAGEQPAVSIDFGAYGPDDGPPFAA